MTVAPPAAVVPSADSKFMIRFGVFPAQAPGAAT
jgi:hypothetical protein